MSEASNFSPRTAHTQEKYQLVLSCQLDEFSPDLSVKTDDIEPLLEKVLLASLELFSKSSFVWRFPICQEVLDIFRRSTSIL